MIEKICKNKLADVTKTHSKRISRKVKENREAAIYNKKIPTIWIQLLNDGSFVHINRLERLYQIYIVDNKKLVKLGISKSGKTENYKVSFGNKFLIMISAFAANAASVASGLDGNDTERLYNLVWNEIEQTCEQGQEPKLMIIKMKQNQK